MLPLAFECVSNKAEAEPADFIQLGHICAVEYYAIARILEKNRQKAFSEQTGRPTNRLTFLSQKPCETSPFPERPKAFGPRLARGIDLRQGRGAPRGAHCLEFDLCCLRPAIPHWRRIRQASRARCAQARPMSMPALAEVRTALIDADVALAGGAFFIAKVRPRAIGENVIRSVTPGQQVIKIVVDCAGRNPGQATMPRSICGSPPAPILMVALQGSGKTTTQRETGSAAPGRPKKKVKARADGVARRQSSRPEWNSYAIAGRTGRRRHPAGGGRSRTRSTIAKRALAFRQGRRLWTF